MDVTPGMCRRNRLALVQERALEDQDAGLEQRWRGLDDTDQGVGRVGELEPFLDSKQVVAALAALADLPPRQGQVLWLELLDAAEELVTERGPRVMGAE